MAEGVGVVEFVDATRINIRYDRTEEEEFVSFDTAVKEYKLQNSRRLTRIQRSIYVQS